MSLQHVDDVWLCYDKDTRPAHSELQPAQGVFQPIHWVAMHRMQCMLRLAPHEGRIADIGCSYGILTLNLAWKRPRAEVIGLDPDEKRLAIGRELCAEHQVRNCRFEKGTVDEPGIPAGSCSGVICTETLDHIEGVKPRLEQTVAKLMDLLLPGGRLILSIPDLNAEAKDANSIPQPPTPLYLKDFDFLANKQVDRNCPRWWHLFYVDKI